MITEVAEIKPHLHPMAVVIGLAGHHINLLNTLLGVIEEIPEVVPQAVKTEDTLQEVKEMRDLHSALVMTAEDTANKGALIIKGKYIFKLIIFLQRQVVFRTTG